jgi:hypothetical protein
MNYLIKLKVVKLEEMDKDPELTGRLLDTTV